MTGSHSREKTAIDFRTDDEVDSVLRLGSAQALLVHIVEFFLGRIKVASASRIARGQHDQSSK